MRKLGTIKGWNCGWGGGKNGVQVLVGPGRRWAEGRANDRTKRSESGRQSRDERLKAHRLVIKGKRLKRAHIISVLLVTTSPTCFGI